MRLPALASVVLLAVVAWPGRAVTQEFALRHGFVRGRVLSPSGAPLASAQVALVPVPSDDGMSGDDLETPAWLESAPRELVERATSGADGRFEIVATPPASDPRLDALYSDVEWVLFVSAPGCRPFALDWPVSGGELLDAGEIRLQPGGGLSGRLVDQFDAPLAGAEVWVDSEWPAGRFGSRAGRSERQAFRTRTDEDGRFLIPSVRAGPLELQARHPEASGDLVTDVVGPAPGTVADLDSLRMTRGGVIRGRIVDASGAPVAGARVHVGDGSLSIDRTEVADPVAVVRRALRRRHGFASDADGRFAAMGVPGGSAHLLVLAPGCDGVLLRCVPAGMDDLEIAMQPEGRLLVQVTDAATEEPVAGAEVIAMRVGGQTLGGEPLTLPVRRVGADEAVFEIGQVGPALHFVQVTAPGYAPAWLEPDGVAPGKFRLETVALRRAALLEGQVTDTDGHPLRGVAVSAYNMPALFQPNFLVTAGKSATAAVRSRTRATSRSGDDGRYTFFELTPGVWSFEAELQGYEMGKDSVTSLAYGGTRSTVIRLRPEADAVPEGDRFGRLEPLGDTLPGPDEIVVRGRVRAAGAPVPGAGVWAERTDSASLLRVEGKFPRSLGAEGTDYHDRPDGSLVEARSDREGAFELRLPRGADWRLCAASPRGGLLLEPQLLSIAPEAPAAIYRDLLLGELRATVTVLDEAGRPLPGCWVWIDPAPIDYLAPSVWRSDEHGRVELEALQPGRYSVTAVLDQPLSTSDEPSRDVARVTQQFDVAEGSGAAIELRLPRGLVLEGSVRSEQGVPVPDRTPVIVGRTTVLTEGGRFTVIGLQPGARRVMVTASGDSWTSEGTLGETTMELKSDAAMGSPATCELVLTFPGVQAYRRELTREEYYAPTSFESAKWKDKQLVGEGVRIRMIDDLLARHDFVGMARADVLALLGPPDERFTEEPVLTWYLGNERSLFAIDSEWLSLTMGDGDRVTAERVWAD